MRRLYKSRSTWGIPSRLPTNGSKRNISSRSDAEVFSQSSRSCRGSPGNPISGRTGVTGAGIFPCRKRSRIIRLVSASANMKSWFPRTTAEWALRYRGSDIPSPMSSTIRSSRRASILAWIIPRLTPIRDKSRSSPPGPKPPICHPCQSSSMTYECYTAVLTAADPAQIRPRKSPIHHTSVHDLTARSNLESTKGTRATARVPFEVWDPGRALPDRDQLTRSSVHARQLAAVRHLTQAHTAQTELAVHRMRPAAALAAGVGANSELRLAIGRALTATELGPSPCGGPAVDMHRPRPTRKDLRARSVALRPPPLQYARPA